MANPDPTGMMDGIELVDLLLTSGFAGTIIATFVKWRYDKKKAPLDRESVLSAASTETVTSSLAISAEYREQLKITKEHFKEAAERQRVRHDEAMTAMQNRHDQALAEMEARHARALAAVQEKIAAIETRNVNLTREVVSLRAAENAKDTQLAAQDARMSRLEHNLSTAKDTVVDLLQYIKAHTVNTTEIPVVDFTIFDH